MGIQLLGVTRNGEHLFPLYATREQAEARITQERQRDERLRKHGWQVVSEYRICQTTARSWQ